MKLLEKFKGIKITLVQNMSMHIQLKMHVQKSRNKAVAMAVEAECD